MKLLLDGDCAVTGLFMSPALVVVATPTNVRIVPADA
jgi:hypothetical protein